MGRNIPSITYRIESKLKEWERFVDLLPASDRAAFQKMVPLIKDRRTAIDAADEDLPLAMLLAMTAHLKSEISSIRGEKNAKETQSRLD